MTVLLDTDVISQLTKSPPDPLVMAWLETQHEPNLYLSSVTWLELRFGVNLLPRGKKRDKLDAWVRTDLAKRFRNRVLAIDERVADTAGAYLAQSEQQGWNLKQMDALIAATASVHGLHLATLNRKHFLRLGIHLVTF